MLTSKNIPLHSSIHYIVYITPTLQINMCLLLMCPTFMLNYPKKAHKTFIKPFAFFHLLLSLLFRLQAALYSFSIHDLVYGVRFYSVSNGLTGQRKSSEEIQDEMTYWQCR